MFFKLMFLSLIEISGFYITLLSFIISYKLRMYIESFPTVSFLLEFRYCVSFQAIIEFTQAEFLGKQDPQGNVIPTLESLQEVRVLCSSLL